MSMFFKNLLQLKRGAWEMVASILIALGVVMLMLVSLMIVRLLISLIEKTLTMVLANLVRLTVSQL